MSVDSGTSSRAGPDNLDGGVAAYTQSFIDSAAPLSFQLFSPVCDGISPERLTTPLPPILHAAVGLRAVSAVEVRVCLLFV